MDSIYYTFKNFTEKLSPNKKCSDPEKENRDAMKRKYSTHEDPFKDSVRHKSLKLDEGAKENIPPQEQLGAEYIRSNNLQKSLGKENSETIKENGEESERGVDDSIKEKHNVKSRVHKKENERSNNEMKTKGVTTKRERPTDEDNDEEEDSVLLEVLEEMNHLVECFPSLASNYRLIDKIGEGTFSSVYKAEALNGSIKMGSEIWRMPPLHNKRASPKRRKNPIVALKQIYVTSSPHRIYNELKLLYLLTGKSCIAPLLDVLRYQDQVVAILPFYHHADFRDFFRDLPIKGVKKYLWELFQALSFIHDKDVLHRDLKPTNFLYDPFTGKGVLVDFGLAEKIDKNAPYKNTSICPCISKEKQGINSSHNKRLNVKAAYPKQDPRPPRRANRAGTRGFRAPEVLFKCTNQTTKIDVWSAGIIGLSIICRKFPFFNSPDDTDAVVELSQVFGIDKLQKCAEIHGCGLEIHFSDYPIKSNGNLVKLAADFLKFEKENESIPDDSVVNDTLSVMNKNGDSLNKPKREDFLDNEEEGQHALENYHNHKHFFQLLYSCLHMDPNKRLLSKEVLKLPFFEEMNNASDEEVVL